MVGTWWAQFEFTRIKTTPTILPKKIEGLREAAHVPPSGWMRHSKNVTLLRSQRNNGISRRRTPGG